MAVSALAGLAAACGGSAGGSGVTVRRLQDAALLAAGDKTRCPLDLGFPGALGGDVQPLAGDGAAAGSPVGRAAAGSSLLGVGGVSYRCAYQAGGKPVSLVVVVVPAGQQTAAAVGALASPLQDAGLDQAAAQALVDAAKGAKAGKGVAAPAGSAAAASANLPGGGASAVAVVAGQGGPTGSQLANAAQKLAKQLTG